MTHDQRPLNPSNPYLSHWRKKLKLPRIKTRSLFYSSKRTKSKRGTVGGQFPKYDVFLGHFQGWWLHSDRYSKRRGQISWKEGRKEGRNTRNKRQSGATKVVIVRVRVLLLGRNDHAASLTSNASSSSASTHITNTSPPSPLFLPSTSLATRVTLSVVPATMEWVSPASPSSPPR